MTMSKKSYRIISLIILSCVFILYGNSIKNEYSLDDEIINYKNPRVAKGIRGIPEIFTTHHVQTTKSNYAYRPVVLITFALEYQFFGKNPHMSHFLNILFYALTCILIFYLLVNFLKEYHIILPLLITFLFVFHPLHTEVVNNLKSRDELLCFLGSLGSLFYCLKYADSGKIKFVLTGMLFLTIAILSKPNAFVFLAIIPLTLYFFSNTNWKRILYAETYIFLSPLIVFVMVQIFIPETTVREYKFWENPLFFDHNLFNRIPTAFYTLAYYLKLLIFPHPLSYYYGYNLIPVADWSAIVSWVSMIFYLVIGIYAIVKLPVKDVISFGILYFLIAISPFANLVYPVVGIVGERFAYIASLGFCWVMAFLLLSFFKIPFKTNNKKVALSLPFVATLVLVFGLYSIRTISRNPCWKDRPTLYRNDVKHIDRSVKAHVMLAGAILRDLSIKKQKKTYQTSGKDQSLLNEAISHFNKALEIYPDLPTAQNNLGSIYFIFFKNYQKATSYFKKAVKIDTGYVEAYYNLGYSYEKSGDPDSAIMSYEKILYLDPKYYLVYARLNNVYINKNAFKKAIEINKFAIQHHPGSMELYANIGNAYILLKDIANAMKYFEYAIKIDPDNYDLLVYVARQYDKIGNKSKALEYLNKAEKIKGHL